MLQHDPDKPEDLDTEAEDHAADSVRRRRDPHPGVRSWSRKDRAGRW